MKIKQLVLISLIVFTIGFGGVLIADYFLPANAKLGGGTNGSAANLGATGTEQVAQNGTPVVTPGGSSSSSNGGASPSTSPAGGGSSAGSPTPATSSAAKPSTSSAAPATSSTPKTSTSTTPTPSTPPAPACGSAGGTCSAAQVATHNTAGNCWVIYNNSYYNVSSYVNAHPGGTAVFNSSTCGKNITTYMTGSASTAGARHAHSNSAYNTLASYRIGPAQ